MKKTFLLVFVLVLLPFTAGVGFVRPVADSLPVHGIDSGKVIAQTSSTTTVYLDPSTINGTVIGQEFNVSIMIRDAQNVYAWQVGLTFNATALECTGFFEGEFLSDAAGPMGTFWLEGEINNTTGLVWPPYACTLKEDYLASGDGRLAYATFKVKAQGVSDIHLTDVKVLDHDIILVPVNIIDVYTVVLDATAHTVVMVSNSTGTSGEYGSGFYDHAFSMSAEKISFKVTGPYTITDAGGTHEVYGSFSNVTIPKTLLNVSTLDDWRVAIDGTVLSTGERAIKENATHTSIDFMYSAGFHYVQITTRPLITSTILITLSSTNVTLGSDVTISGDIVPIRPSITVTILCRCKVYALFRRWTMLATLTTDPNSHYNYTWTLEKAATYEFMAVWEGDDNTFGDVSDVQTLTVLPIYVFEVEGTQVIIQTNATISAPNFSQPLKQISFNATGPESTTVFCNITIPKTLMWVDALDEWNVTIDGTPLSTQEINVTSNGTHYFIYFTCNTSTVTIQVISKHVIPEFPTWTSMLLILILLTVAITITKRRLLKTPTR